MFVQPGVLFLILGSAQVLADDPLTAPPPAPVAPERFHYAGPAGQAELTADEIAARVAEDREARHLVWQDGWPTWRAWSEVPAVEEALSHLPPPLPPPLPTAAPAVVAPPPVPAAVPAPVESAPAEPPPAEPPLAAVAPEPGPAPGCCGAPKLVHVGGEVWLNFAAPHLESAGSEQEGQFEPTFAIRRARLKAAVTFGHGISGWFTADFPQSGSSSEYSVDIQNVYDRLAAVEGSSGADDPSVSVRDYPKGWATVMKDAYLDWDLGNDHHRVRAGLQKPIFGTRDFSDDFDNFFMGGEAAYKSLAWRAGLEDSRDVGLAYRLTPVEAFSLDAQVLNGTGDGDLDDNAGKDFSARASVALPAGVSAQVSGLYGIRGEDEQESLRQLDASLRWDVAFLRLLAEGLFGKVVQGERATPFLGADFVAMAVWPIEGERFERFDITARYMFFDPWVEEGEDTVPDASYILDAGAFLHWRVAEQQRVVTGVVFENLTTQDLDAPVEHGLTAQVLWYF